MQKREKKDDGSWRPERSAAKQWFWAWQDCWTQELIVAVAAGHYLDVTKPVWEGSYARRFLEIADRRLSVLTALDHKGLITFVHFLLAKAGT